MPHFCGIFVKESTRLQYITKNSPQTNKDQTKCSKHCRLIIIGLPDNAISCRNVPELPFMLVAGLPHILWDLFPTVISNPIFKEFLDIMICEEFVEMYSNIELEVRFLVVHKLVLHACCDVSSIGGLFYQCSV